MQDRLIEFAAVNEDGTYVFPSGPCSLWPEERGRRIRDEMISGGKKKVKAGLGEMVGGVFKTGYQAITTGRTSEAKREARYSECQKCEHFIPDSKRCSLCGCFMEAKTWIEGASCPAEKW